MGLIFFLSSQNASESSRLSGGFIEEVAQAFYSNFEDKTPDEQQKIIESFQFVARKSAHFCIFAVLGVFSFLSFISYRSLRLSTRVIFSVLISCIYAASDEIHQNFVVGRSCEFRDFLIDSLGVLLGVFVCVLLVKIIKPLRFKTAYKKL